jgi:hypothetical protein
VPGALECTDPLNRMGASQRMLRTAPSQEPSPDAGGEAPRSPKRGLEIYRSETMKSEKFIGLVKELNQATTMGFSKKDLFARTQRKVLPPRKLPLSEGSSSCFSLRP